MTAAIPAPKLPGPLNPEVGQRTGCQYKDSLSRNILPPESKNILDKVNEFG